MDLREQYQHQHLNPGNALFGVILICTLPNPLHVTVSDDERKCLRYRFGLLWISGYSVWTAVCVYNLAWYPALNLVLLYVLTPLIMLLWTDCNEWVQHLTYSLYFSQCVNLLPAVKNNLPFYVLDYEHSENDGDWMWIKEGINWLALCCGLVVLFKSLCEEINSWNGETKPFATSFVQWYTLSKARIAGLGHLPYESARKSFIVRKFEAAQFRFRTPNVTRLFMVREERDEYV